MDRKLALEDEDCVRILRRAGCVPRTKDGYIAWISLNLVPAGLDAVELQDYLREYGAQICRYSYKPSRERTFASPDYEDHPHENPASGRAAWFDRADVSGAGGQRPSGYPNDCWNPTLRRIDEPKTDG